MGFRGRFNRKAASRRGRTGEAPKEKREQIRTEKGWPRARDPELCRIFGRKQARKYGRANPVKHSHGTREEGEKKGRQQRPRRGRKKRDAQGTIYLINRTRVFLGR